MACFRLHQRQTVDFRIGRKSRDQYAKGEKAAKPTSTFLRRLGHHDQVVSWKRPPKMPMWMTATQWALIPESLEVRELRYTISANGQRTREVTIATIPARRDWIRCCIRRRRWPNCMVCVGRWRRTLLN